MSAPATKEDIARLEAKLDAVLAAVGSAAPTSADDVISSAEVMAMLRITSPSALSRMCRKLGLRRLSQNRFRRGDVENAVGRATMPRR